MEMPAKRLVRSDQDPLLRPVPKSTERALHLLLRGLRTGHILDLCSGRPLVQPFVELSTPILDERRRAYDNSFFHGAPWCNALTQEGPNYRNRLQSLPQPHVISQDAPVPSKILQSHQTIKHELYPNPLVLTEDAGQVGVHLNWLALLTRRWGPQYQLVGVDVRCWLLLNAARACTQITVQRASGGNIGQHRRAPATCAQCLCLDRCGRIIGHRRLESTEQDGLIGVVVHRDQHGHHGGPHKDNCPFLLRPLGLPDHHGGERNTLGTNA
mmetsp:Transcript_22428/g.48996  ORF Transcript_22428/g.48996 Transcript_22428/m.48996 type:complete len:269 (-) Transcript_22428:12-818(-)